MEKTKKKNKEKDKKSNENENIKILVLYNDDYHTFDYVISALINVCNHQQEQAVQCTYLVHFKGKCDVLTGGFEYLKPLKDQLLKLELKAEIK